MYPKNLIVELLLIKFSTYFSFDKNPSSSAYITYSLFMWLKSFIKLILQLDILLSSPRFRFTANGFENHKQEGEFLGANYSIVFIGSILKSNIPLCISTFFYFQFGVLRTIISQVKQKQTPFNFKIVKMCEMKAIYLSTLIFF